MAHVPIVNDYQAISQGLSHLEKSRLAAKQFALPDGVVVYLSSNLRSTANFINCRLCLLLDAETCRLHLALMSSTETLDTAFGRGFVRYLERHFGSAYLRNRCEIQLSTKDRDKFIEQVHLQ